MSERIHIQIVPRDDRDDGSFIYVSSGLMIGLPWFQEVQISLSFLGASASRIEVKLEMSESVKVGQQMITSTSTVDEFCLWESKAFLFFRTTDVYAGAFPFFINIPENLPPTASFDQQGYHLSFTRWETSGSLIIISTGIEIQYLLHATVYRGKRTKFWKDPPYSCSIPIKIEKYEFHPAWPIYHNPKPKYLDNGSVRFSARLPRTCYCPGEAITLATGISFASPRIVPGILEFGVKLWQHLVTKADGAEPPQQLIQETASMASSIDGAPIINLITRQASCCATTNDATTFSAELVCQIPEEAVVPTLNYGSHIQVTYVLEVTTLFQSQQLKVDVPIVISPFQSNSLDRRLEEIEFVPSLGGAPCFELPSLSSNTELEDAPTIRRSHTLNSARMPQLQLIAKYQIVVSSNIVGIGGFSDVYPAEWIAGDRMGKERLAVKFFRKVDIVDNGSMLRTFQRRLIAEISTLLNASHHPNILPFIGVYHHDASKPPALVCPLREAGDILQYLSKNLVNCRPLVIGIANGLAHLHSHNIVHGDLKPQNVLINVDKDGRPTPEISDFGRARILNVRGYAGNLHPTRRYTAPEVLFPFHTADSPVLEIPSDIDNRSLTKASDVWSLGMVILHVLSGREPYPRAGSNEGMIVANLHKGLEPEEKDHPNFPNRAIIWPLLRRCWRLADGPKARWSAQDCSEAFKMISLDEHSHN
ncbi:hypothetical protein NP233_g504 [Leucocoprinus birnbaumii]|uniref:Protein kinase domain-containing protein n=1 Tax=Leucocoprinus birnbaumii TaxID=56174 RepID=A0AAD5Z097_9AGAR|nr:hypothetical protein NP233_g504 [Leucocoprinus birnbaumii]